MRTAPAPMLMLSRLVRDNGFKVVMTGEGADEVFAGYDVFKEAKVRRFCAAQPASKRRPQLLQASSTPIMPRLQGQSQRYLEAFFGGHQEALDDPLYSHLPRFRSSAGAKAFFSADLRAEIGNYDALADLRDRLPADFMRWHPLSQSQYLESAYLLPGYILSSQGDRVGMANAVEGRFPFLDHRLIELAARIPPRLKLKGLTEKHILRQSMKHLLPGGIAKRPKQPYRAPESRAFLRSRAAAAVLDHMSRANIDAPATSTPSSSTAWCRSAASSPRPVSATTSRSSASFRPRSGTRRSSTPAIENRGTALACSNAMFGAVTAAARIRRAQRP